MRILGIETSCDETAVAVLEILPRQARDEDIIVLSNIISSQVKLHAKFGGVVPNLAAREHVKNIKHVFNLALDPVRSLARAKSASPQDLGETTSYGIKEAMDDIDLIAVTRGPGLGPALLIGISFAKTLAWKYNKPIVGVNHLEGHIYSNFLKKVGVDSKFDSDSQLRPETFDEKIRKSKIFPILNLIVSGGHTELVLMEGHRKYKLIGETLDDAIGEAFDKVARLLGLSYPGGPIVSKLAEQGNPDRYPLPSPMIHGKNFNFSYSGLKTAVLYLIRDLENSPSNPSRRISAQQKFDIAASFQKAATRVLIKKTVKAAKEYKVKSVFLSGGVSANKSLRIELAEAVKELRMNYSQPELEYTGDNAAMIALAGYINKFKMKNDPFDKIRDRLEQSRTDEKLKIKTDWKSVEMDANLGF